MNQNIKEMILSDVAEDAYLAMNIMDQLGMNVQEEVHLIFFSQDVKTPEAMKILFNYYNWRDENEPEHKGNDPFGL